MAVMLWCLRTLRFKELATLPTKMLGAISEMEGGSNSSMSAIVRVFELYEAQLSLWDEDCLFLKSPRLRAGIGRDGRFHLACRLSSRAAKVFCGNMQDSREARLSVSGLIFLWSLWHPVETLQGQVDLPARVDFCVRELIGIANTWWMALSTNCK